MLDRIREILSRIHFSHQKQNAAQASAKDEGGKVYAVWLLILPLFAGVVLCRLAGAVMGYTLDKLVPDSGMTDSAVTGFQEKAQDSAGQRGLDGFLSSNPFRISPQKPDTPPPAPKPAAEEKPKEPEPSLDDVILRGTLPGVGGWFEQEGQLKLILVGKNIDRFRLASVEYDSAQFRRGRTRITKYITYGPVAAKPKEEAPKPAPAPTPAPAPARQTGNITAASENSEGSVPAEMVQSLVQNPFDEHKRIRMRPNDKAGGLEVQWIQNDSILKRLGVKRGDVIKSVNGIPFTNMGDIANSINSLMNSERFDVEVTRGGKSTPLRYVVK